MGCVVDLCGIYDVYIFAWECLVDDYGSEGSY